MECDQAERAPCPYGARPQPTLPHQRERHFDLRHRLVPLASVEATPPYAVVGGGRVAPWVGRGSVMRSPPPARLSASTRATPMQKLGSPKGHSRAPVPAVVSNAWAPNDTASCRCPGRNAVVHEASPRVKTLWPTALGRLARRSVAGSMSYDGRVAPPARRRS